MMLRELFRLYGKVSASLSVGGEGMVVSLFKKKKNFFLVAKFC